MSLPRVVAVDADSPAAHAGLRSGDEFVTVNGRVPRDVLEYRWLVDEPLVVLEVARDGSLRTIEVTKAPGEPLGAEVHSAVFDRVMTCDNHCEFCFIYQLPPGMRRSLYLKDDDYRLSFLYGNFTTLTRFTEADFERVLDEGLSPLHVSIHATDPDVRAEMLRNRRGATSLRWLEALLDAGVEVHGQVVVCPSINDGAVLEDTMIGVLDRFSSLASLCVVPLGVSAHNHEPRMRPHTRAEAVAVLACVHRYQEVFLSLFGRRLVFAADEYYLLAGEPFPPEHTYEGFPMHEDGVGMARAFEADFARGATGRPDPTGFFRSVDGAPAEGYRAPRTDAAGCAAETADPGAGTPVALGARRDGPVTVLTGAAGALVLAPILAAHGFGEVEILAVDNQFFGGTTSVTGLLVGADVARVLRDAPSDRRYLLPDVCLTNGRFLDGTSPSELAHTVEVVPTDGGALRRLLDETRSPGRRTRNSQTAGAR